MGDSDSIVLKIDLDDGQWKAKLKNVEGETASAFKRIGEIALGVFGGNVLEHGFERILDSAKELFGEMVNSAKESEQAIQGLNTALGISGRYSAEASAQFQELADKIEATTAVSDDSVLGLERLAVTYTKTNSQALKLTETSVNLAAVTGQDVNTALQQLAGTLSGQAGRLQKLFPELQTFTASQLRAGAAVEFFNHKFAGAAASQVDTYSGRVTQLANAFDDFLKTTGKLITGSPAVVATIKAITDTIRGGTELIRKQFSGQDLFKDLIINFSVVAQAGIETGRQIGKSFERGYLVAKQAWIGFKVLSTAGLSDAFNKELMDVNEQIAQLDMHFHDDSAATQWFSNLINQVNQASAVTKDKFSSLGKTTGDFSGAITSLGQTFKLMKEGAVDALEDLWKVGQKVFRDLGGTTIKAFANGVAQGMAAIGKALVKGQDIFAAFAGAMLSALGQAAIEMGSAYILMGIARIVASYGADASGYKLVAIGGAMAVAGGALMAVGEGVSGKGNAAGNVTASSGSGGAVASSTDSSSVASEAQVQNPNDSIRDEKQTSIAVHIHGDVLDSRESGLRIVELINDTFNAQGMRVQVS